MSWLILVVAGLFDIVWAVGLKYTSGFTRLWPSVGIIAAMIVSVGMPGIAMKSLPAGTAYAIWVEIGIVGNVAIGIAFLNEPVDAARVISIALIILGIVGLKLATPG